MAIRILHPSAYEAQPWRNGLGTSRTVASAGAGGQLDWLLSLTAIERDCPFSDYRGYDRVFTPVAGHGVVLTVDGAASRLDANDRPFAFAGDARVDCRLIDGPVAVVNAMVRRAWGVQTVTVLHGRTLHYGVTAPIVLLHALRRAASLTIAGRSHALEPGGTLQLDGEAGAHVDIEAAGDGAIYAVAFRPAAA